MSPTVNIAWVSSLNQSLFLWLNHACTIVPDWLWSSITITAHTSMVFALFALFLLPRFRRTDIITSLFIAACVGGTVSTVVKEWLQVMRPAAVLAPEQFHLIGHKLHLVSFPSGHTLSAFAISALLLWGFKLRGWPFIGVIALAICAGLSRIAVGAHWPLDVLGGATLGLLCGFISWQAGQWLHRKEWTQKVIYAYLQSGVILLVSATLFLIDMGYPKASFWQTLVASFGVMASVYSLLVLLKSNR